ncbi:MAG: phage late control D family protein [Myxococcota bacterium]
MSNPNDLTVDVKFDGKTKLGSFELKDGDHIHRIEVDDRLESPTAFSVTLKAGDVSASSSKTFDVLDHIKLGLEVEIKLGYEKESTVCKGEVSRVEPEFHQSGNLVRISGYDIVHRLTRGTNSRVWGDGHKAKIKVGDVAKDVIKDSKAREGGTGDSLSGKTDPGDNKHTYIAQYEMSDYQFLRGLGVGTSLAFDAKASESSKKLEFKKIDLSGSPKVTICRENKDPVKAKLSQGADFTLSSVQQVAKVEVRGWDPVKKKAILGSSKSVSSSIDGKSGPKHAGKAHYGSASTGRVLTVVDCPVSSKAEADEIAGSIFDGLATEFCTADVVIEGTSEVCAGDVVELKQFGKFYDGKYLVNSALHTVYAGEVRPYTTRLGLVRNSSPG